MDDTDTIRQTEWNTYSMRGYTHDVANDQRSAGGVHFLQVRRGPAGWQKRVLQSNGTATAAGPIEVLDTPQGEAYFEQAKAYANFK